MRGRTEFQSPRPEGGVFGFFGGPRRRVSQGPEGPRREGELGLEDGWSLGAIGPEKSLKNRFWACLRGPHSVGNCTSSAVLEGVVPRWETKILLLLRIESLEVLRAPTERDQVLRGVCGLRTASGSRIPKRGLFGRGRTKSSGIGWIPSDLEVPPRGL